MKRLLTYLIILALCWFAVTQIIIPVICGVIGSFDNTQEEYKWFRLERIK